VKKKLMKWIAISFSFIATIIGCPTCVGRIENNDKAFFSRNNKSTEPNYYDQNIAKSSSITNQDNTPASINDEDGFGSNESEDDNELGDDNDNKKYD